MGSVNRQQIPDIDLAATGQTLSRRERVSAAAAVGRTGGGVYLRRDRAHYFLSSKPVLGQRSRPAFGGGRQSLAASHHHPPCRRAVGGRDWLVLSRPDPRWR